MMPLPRVAVRNSLRNPISPRVGMVYSMRTLPLSVFLHHVRHGAPAGGHGLGDDADIVLGGFDHQVLDRLMHHAVDLARDDLRARHLELEALAAHRLDQDRQVQLAPPGDEQIVGAGRSPRRAAPTFVSSSR